MKIQTTITSNEEVNIELPKYWRTAEQDFCSKISYLAVLNENTAISLEILPDYTSIVNTTPTVLSSKIIVAVKSWEQITEEDFLSYHEMTLKDLSLSPALINDADDLRGLFEQSERGKEIDNDIENELNRTT